MAHGEAPIAPADLAAIRARHVRTVALTAEYCRACRTDWPCDAARPLAALDAEHDAAQAVYAEAERRVDQATALLDETTGWYDRLEAAERKAAAALAYVREPFAPSPAAAWIAFVAAVEEGEMGEQAKAVLAGLRAGEEG